MLLPLSFWDKSFFCPANPPLFLFLLNHFVKGFFKVGAGPPFLRTGPGCTQCSEVQSTDKPQSLFRKSFEQSSRKLAHDNKAWIGHRPCLLRAQLGRMHPIRGMPHHKNTPSLSPIKMQCSSLPQTQYEAQQSVNPNLNRII